MIVKVCGMRDAGNICAIVEAGADMVGLTFVNGSPRCVRMVSSRSGIMPDYVHGSMTFGVAGASHCSCRPSLVGVFMDDMPQNVVARVYKYGLDYVQLDGGESPVMMENLRATVDPDIRRGLKLIKTIKVGGEEDFGKCAEYAGVADLFLFDMTRVVCGAGALASDLSVLDAYHGDTPFLLGGCVASGDADRVRALRHPMLAGVDINTCFETAPAVKDERLVSDFISRLRG